MATPDKHSTPWHQRWRRRDTPAATDWADMGTCIGLDCSMQPEAEPKRPIAAAPRGSDAASAARTGAGGRRWWAPFATARRV